MRRSYHLISELSAVRESVLYACFDRGRLTTRADIAAAWEALLATDVLIFFLTLAGTYKNWRQYTPPGRISLHTLLLRDGTCYKHRYIFARIDSWAQGHCTLRENNTKSVTMQA